VINGAPWPVSVLIVGDSWSNNPAITDWAELFQANFPGLTIVNEATSQKCLWDTTSPLGTDTVRNSIDADLAANPNADFVIWGTAAGNDIIRRKLAENAVVLSDITTAGTYVLNAIAAANKRAIVLCCPWIQALVYSGFGTGTEADAIVAYQIRSDWNAWLRTECERRGFIYYEPKWMWVDLGPSTVTGGNGMYVEFNADFLHPNEKGSALMAEDFAGMLRANNFRRRLVA
jgi:lysophospholipase L1-like esterase